MEWAGKEKQGFRLRGLTLTECLIGREQEEENRDMPKRKEIRLAQKKNRKFRLSKGNRPLLREKEGKSARRLGTWGPQQKKGSGREKPQCGRAGDPSGLIDQS